MDQGPRDRDVKYSYMKMYCRFAWTHSRHCPALSTGRDMWKTTAERVTRSSNFPMTLFVRLLLVGPLIRQQRVNCDVSYLRIRSCYVIKTSMCGCVCVRILMIISQPSRLRISLPIAERDCNNSTSCGPQKQESSLPILIAFVRCFFFVFLFFFYKYSIRILVIFTCWREENAVGPGDVISALDYYVNVF